MPVADRILQALKDHENDRPRSQQVRLGPSELGGCREYIRNVMIGAPTQGNDEWPTAAAVGTLVGDHVETVVAERLGAVTQVPVTATLPNGLKVSGHADAVFVEDNIVVDVKTKDSTADVRREGPSLENCIQISVYTLGLVQAGILSEGASASLIYIDRAGNEQTIYEVELDWERIQYFIEKCIERLDEVVMVQEMVDQGEVEHARSLRDKTPPFCYSPKVMCPFRDLCWKGSEWVPNTEIEDADTIQVVEEYDKVRAELKDATAVKGKLRDKLIGVSGKTPSGLAVTWAGSEARPMLYVTQVKDKK